MRFYTMAFVGMLSFRSLLLGSLANRICAPDALFIDGPAYIIGSYLFFTRLPVRRKMSGQFTSGWVSSANYPPELR
jgi:hypothetical protein